MESESVIPEPPDGTPLEVSRRAWQVAWSASNAAAGYHASIINHLVAHEKKVLDELARMRSTLSRDFADFRSTLLASLRAVGIHVELSTSGEHAQATVGDGPRDHVASSHDLETGLAEVSERIEETLDERLRDIKIPGNIPSERVREMIDQERAHVEAEQKIMRLELEKSQMALTHAQEIKRLDDQRGELAKSNTRWLRIALMIFGAALTVLGGLLLWMLTRQPSGGH